MKESTEEFKCELNYLCVCVLLTLLPLSFWKCCHVLFPSYVERSSASCTTIIVWLKQFTSKDDILMYKFVSF